MNLVVDSELLQPYQAVKTIFVHCTWYRRCIWTPHIIFNQIHDVEFLALFEPFACFPNNVRRGGILVDFDLAQFKYWYLTVVILKGKINYALDNCNTRLHGFLWGIDCWGHQNLIFMPVGYVWVFFLMILNQYVSDIQHSFFIFQMIIISMFSFLYWRQ